MRNKDGCREWVWWFVWYSFGHIIKHGARLLNKYVWSFLVNKHLTFDQSYSKLHSFFSISIPKKYFVSLAESKISLSRCDSNPNSWRAILVLLWLQCESHLGGKGYGGIQNGGCPVVDDVPLAHLPDRLLSCPRFSRCDLEPGESSFHFEHLIFEAN